MPYHHIELCIGEFGVIADVTPLTSALGTPSLLVQVCCRFKIACGVDLQLLLPFFSTPISIYLAVIFWCGGG